MTPTDMPDFGWVILIDASALDAGKAYVSAHLPLLDDFRSHVWKTKDYGESWTRIVTEIREDAYVNSVREDPHRDGLQHAGTNHGVYVSFDDGGVVAQTDPGTAGHSGDGSDPGARRAGDGEPWAGVPGCRSD